MPTECWARQRHFSYLKASVTQYAVSQNENLLCIYYKSDKIKELFVRSTLSLVKVVYFRVIKQSFSPSTLNFIVDRLSKSFKILLSTI